MQGPSALSKTTLIWEASSKVTTFLNPPWMPENTGQPGHVLHSIPKEHQLARGSRCLRLVRLATLVAGGARGAGRRSTLVLFL